MSGEQTSYGSVEQRLDALDRTVFSLQAQVSGLEIKLTELKERLDKALAPVVPTE